MSARATSWRGLYPDWVDRAACREIGPEAFAPAGEEAKPSVETAKKVCRRCPVSPECLQDSLDRRENFGVWGGLDENERRELLRDMPRLCLDCDEELTGSARRCRKHSYERHRRSQQRYDATRRRAA